MLMFSAFFQKNVNNHYMKKTQKVNIDDDSEISLEILTLQKVADRIRALRLRQRLTIEGFSKKAGFNSSWYGSIERGKQNITLLTLLKIAQAFNVSIKDLIPDDI
jgi:DNA-binding XRE family transcriptional regulator